MAYSKPMSDSLAAAGVKPGEGEEQHRDQHEDDVLHHSHLAREASKDRVKTASRDAAARKERIKRTASGAVPSTWMKICPSWDLGAASPY
jgi:hypothetical protein